MNTFHPEQTTFKIGSEHPSLPGHFPDNPIVPGVVMLSRILSGLSQHLESLELTCQHLASQDPLNYEVEGIRKVKFLQPLLAEQEFHTQFGAINNSKIRFKCLLVADQTILAEGNLKLCRRKD